MSIEKSSKILKRLADRMRIGDTKYFFLGPVTGQFIDESSKFLKFETPRWKKSADEELKKLREIQPLIQVVFLSYTQLEINNESSNLLNLNLEEPGWKKGAEEELKKLREIHPLIQSVVSSYIQLEIEDLDLEDWLCNLRHAFVEASDFFYELAVAFNYVNPAKVSSKLQKMKSSGADHTLFCYKTLERITEVIPSVLMRMNEALCKLYNISAKVSAFRQFLEDEEQHQFDILATHLHPYTTNSEILYTSQSDEDITDVPSDHASMESAGNIHGLKRGTTDVPSHHSTMESAADNIHGLKRETTDVPSHHSTMESAANIYGLKIRGTEIESGSYFSPSYEAMESAASIIQGLERGMEIENGGSSLASKVIKTGEKYYCCFFLRPGFKFICERMRCCYIFFYPAFTAGEITKKAKYCCGFSLSAFVLAVEMIMNNYKSIRERISYKVSLLLLLLSFFCSFFLLITPLEDKRSTQEGLGMSTQVGLRMRTQACLITFSVICLLTAIVNIATSILL